MPTIKTKKEKLQEEKRIVQEIKPHLGKFVTDRLVKGAVSSSAEAEKERSAIMSNDEVITESGRLAAKAFFELRVFEATPPYLEMKWIVEGAFTDERIREREMDISGFALYLVREYQNFLKLQNSGTFGYPNPMQEENLPWFWQKMQVDLRLLIEAEKRRAAHGGSGIIIPTSNVSSFTIEPNKNEAG